MYRGLVAVLGDMKINGSKVSEIVENHGTPLYVYNENKIREKYRELEESLCSRYDNVQINYAVKSNFNPRIAEILLDEGAGLDCASKAELELADRLDAEEVMYTAPYNRKDELEYAVEKGAEVNLDSVFLLDKMNEAPEMICFRIDPEIDSDRDLMFAGGDAKFGISEEKAVEAYRKAKKMGVEKFGIHMMTGSNVTDASYFEYITERLLKVAKRVSREVGIEFEFVDIGGGLGIPYRPEEDSLDLDPAAEGIVKEMEKGIEQYDIGEPELRLEPGRYLTAEAGHLISRVTGVKQKDTEYVGLDTGMHQILRPSLLDSYHEIRKVEKKDNPTTEERTVVGQVCSSIDVIAEERKLPILEQGDLVSIEDVGAYGFVMASHWNSRPLPAEVLVQGNGVELIRERQNKEQIFHGTSLEQ